MKNALLTLDQVKSRAPNAFATTHDGRRSDRYTFVPTEEIINRMDSLGWGVSKAVQPRGRTENTKDFGKHMIAFRDRNAVGIPDPRLRVINHGSHQLDTAMIHPEILIINSSNGSSRLEVQAGLFALICANGLVISVGSFGTISLKHSGFDPDTAYGLVNDFAGRMDKVGDRIQTFQSVNLTRERQLEYATEAARIRWDDNIPDPSTLLMAQRGEDTGDDLWTVYNKVQEHVIGGGQKLGKRLARKLTNIDKSVDINSKLWDLTEAYSRN
jgi:hypothetical protein